MKDKSLITHKEYVMKYITKVLSIFFIFLIACNTSTTEPEAREFQNTLWHLESIEITNDEIIKPPENQIYTIKFLDDSTFLGNNACNEISGEYKLLSNSKIVVEKLGTTFALCREGTIHDEYYSAINDLRSHEATYEIQQNKLYINYGVNSRMVFILR